MKIETDKRSCKQLLIQRMLLASVSSVMLQFFLVCCLVLFANLSVDYALWLHATWAAFTSPRMWFYLVFLSTVTSLQAYLCSRIYLCIPSYHKSRFAKLRASLTTQNLLLSIFYTTMGGILVWLHSSLVGGRYSLPVVECNVVRGKCLLEEYYFLLLGGCWSGFYYFLRSDNVSRSHFSFPIIAQSKFSRLKRSIYAELPTLAFSSTWSAAYYMLAYYTLGSYYRSALSAISAMTEHEVLDTVSSLLNFTLISRLWLHQFLFALTISITHLFFEIYMTEWVWFKIGTSCAFSTDSPELTLADALSMDKVPIMQHLGYLDLVNVAQREKHRRGLLFTLSQPGGHPYNWNCVVQRSMDLLRNFTIDLNTICLKPSPQDRPFGGAPTVTANGKALQNDYLYRMRKLVQDIPPPTTTTSEVSSQEAPVCNEWLVQRFVRQKKDAFVAYLLSKPLINYVFGEQEDNKIRYVLSNSQLVIWAAEAISSLTVFSLSEDNYGIVLKDVKTILYVLLSVKQSLDKLHKSSVSTRKTQMDDKFTRETFVSLRSAIKRSLYKIVTHFEPHINGLYLEPVKMEQLQSYLNYKE